jgi:hypothetical protein
MKPFTWMILIVLFCLVSARSAFAQINQGPIAGTVIDSSGRVILEATMTLTNKATSLTYTRSTNAMLCVLPIKGAKGKGAFRALSTLRNKKNKQIIRAKPGLTACFSETR